MLEFDLQRIEEPDESTVLLIIVNDLIIVFNRVTVKGKCALEETFRDF
jgi:hypothetical protein